MRNSIWSGGISNGLTVIEQVTYLLFARRLNEMHTAKEAQGNLLGQPIEDPIFSPRKSDCEVLHERRGIEEIRGLERRFNTSLSDT
ncbi:hypothetical protein GCM10023155_01540 [Bremerella cremea]